MVAGQALTVHPHVCGEHPFRKHQLIARHRFIPTCVGNMDEGFDILDRSAVHPHVCGEHSVMRSMPLPALRFIPTCVGNIIS